MRQRCLCYALFVFSWSLHLESFFNKEVASASAKERIEVRPAPSTIRTARPAAHTQPVEQNSPVDGTIRATLRLSSDRLEKMTQEALSLASKGATYSASAKLITVLELTADQLDEEQRTTAHNAALVSGLTALREADDFSQSGWKSNGDAAEFVRSMGHSTPVLRRRDVESLTRTDALERYYSYASRQLASAVANDPAGSTALYHLGRLQPFLLEGAEQDRPLLAARMVAWHRAALDADPKNFRAANELGVVLAGSGQWEAAKEAFITSAELGRRPETISNLGIVLHKLGDQAGARSMVSLASQQRDTSRQRSGRDVEPRPFLRWVDHREFALCAAPEDLPAAVMEIPPARKELQPSKTERVSQKLKPGWMRFPEKLKTAFHRGASDEPRVAADDSRSQAVVRPVRRSRTESSSDDEAEVEMIGLESAIDSPVLYEDAFDAPAINMPVEDAGAGFCPTYSLPQQGVPFGDSSYGHGEYIGPPRTPHVPEYFLRVGDLIGFVFRLNGKPSTTPYRLNVGDVIRITSLTAENLELETLVQPDGTIVLPQVGSVSAAGKTIDVLRKELDERYKEFIREPSIAVAPVTINKTLEELRNAIITRTGLMNGQQFSGKVAPNGMIQLPAIGSVPAHGMSLDELRREVELRYMEIASGVEVTPVLQERAPRYIYVLGEVSRPGRFDLVGPTSAIQAISLAGSWNKGGNMREVIVLRRDECWQLLATRLNVRPALYNKPNLEADDIWLRDSDIVIVPKLPIQVADDCIEMIFTRGIYGVIPFNGVTLSFFKDLSSLGTIP